MLNLVGLFYRGRSREAMRLAGDAKVSLIALESHLALVNDKRGMKLAAALHRQLGDTLAETGRIMGVDVTPLSGGGPKPE